MVAAALQQRLERRSQSQLVKRRRPQVGDDGVQVLDLLLDLPNRLIDDERGLLGVAAAARRGQQQAQRAKTLQRLVVQLARPAGALALSRLHAIAQPLDLHRSLCRKAL